MADISESNVDPIHMRLVHPSLSFTTTATTDTDTTCTRTTSRTAIRSPPYPIPILITTAPQTPSPAATPQSSPSSIISDSSTRARKRLAPGLQARLRRFEEQNQHIRDTAQRLRSIGRIPEEQLAELEHFQREQREKKQSGVSPGRVRPWTSPVNSAASPTAMPVSGGVRLSGGPVWTDNEMSITESGDDFSSAIDISEDLAGDTTEDDEALYLDKHKYRMPSPSKARLQLNTREPLSPSPRQVVGMRPSSPPKMDSAHSSHWRNSSVETVSDSDWTGAGVSRAGSIYSLSRVSFSGQLSQLTSMRLPDASSLSKRILSMSSASEAARALFDAAEQIRMWISKASEVLSKLEAEDDVEWAAAGGQEGIEDVVEAIKRFDQLVRVYILSIERLQTREDITQLPHADLKHVERQMENIIGSWQKIKDTLRSVKDQTEIAIEWMRLWNTVLGEIGQETDSLNELVFEMEEKRHQSAESLLTSRDSIGLDELQTIVGDHAGRMKVPSSQKNNRLSIPTFFPSSPVQAPVVDKEDSSLLALFARMQPLRASLDFLPMQLSTFQTRGGDIFPTACADLDQRRERLETQWTKLEADAESLRRELGEDKWVLVFRNAGRQALKMCESIARSYSKLRDAVESGEHETNIPSITKKVENYEAKKTHYGPAIERVLSIVDRGVLDRLTVNGEVLRLQSEMRHRWAALQVEMRDVDHIVDGLTHHTRDKELRDSVSTVVSSERSVASSLVETPNSSPASSVISPSRRNSLHGSRTPTALTTVKVRTGSHTSTSTASKPRLPSSSIPRRSLLPRASLGGSISSTSSPANTPSTTHTPSKSSTTSTPVSWPASSRPELQPSNRPRWNAAVKPESRDFRPLAASEPSPYMRSPLTPRATYLRSTPKPSPSHHPSSLPTSTSKPTTTNPSSPGPSPRTVTSPSSLPRPIAHPPSISSSSTLTKIRHTSLPAPAPAIPGPASNNQTYTPSKNLSARSSNPVLRPGSRISSSSSSSAAAAAIAAAGRRPRVFRDGNDADTEAGPIGPSPWRAVRPPSGLGGAANVVPHQGKRSSSLFSAARLRLRGSMEFVQAGVGRGAEGKAGSSQGGNAQVGVGMGGEGPKPRWRV